MHLNALRRSLLYVCIMLKMSRSLAHVSVRALTAAAASGDLKAPENRVLFYKKSSNSEPGYKKTLTEGD